MAQVLETMARTDEQRAQNRAATTRRLVAELAQYRTTIVAAFVFVVISAVAQALGPVLIGHAIDSDLARGDVGALGLTMSGLFITYLVGALATRAQINRVGVVGQQLLAALRARIFDQFLRLPLRYFDRQPIGDLMSRVTNDVDTLNQVFTQGVTQLVGSFFSLIGFVIAMLLLNWRLALVSFTIVPVMLLTTRLFAVRARAAYRETRATTGSVTAGLQEEIVGVREAQAFNRTEANIERFRERNRANRDANVQAVGITSAFSPTIDALSTLATALVIGYGGWLVVRGELTVGLLTAFLIYVQQFFRPVQLVAQVATQFQSALAGAERIFAILDEEPEPADAPDAIDPGQLTGAIAFDHVTFGYDPAHPVLFDVSFTVDPGQTIALVGRTGAGKTTVANLIPRFYDVTGGVVRVDGHDVRALTRVGLRREIAIVLQEPFLFSGTVRENIAYGREGATDAEIEAAARAVSAHDFISQLPQGYDTPLGERGGSLSQGQRQLLAFARAVLADPRILILDEATSNIDTRTEQLIQTALATLLQGRTSVVIAHRLSTIRTADQILVIDDGRIVERGRHAELLAANGRYAELYRRQFREEVGTGTG